MLTFNAVTAFFADRPAHRNLWRLAAPMMLSNVSVAVLGLVDTAVIGHLEDASYLAGVALATVLFDFLYWGVTFLRMGTTGIAAQVHGARDSQAMAGTLRDALLVALAISLAMLVLREPILDFGLSLLGGSTQASEQAALYFSIKIWGAPGVLTTMVCVGWLIGVQNARAAMLLAAAPCLLHAVLDVVFVVVLELGVRGAACAALVTAYVSAGLGLRLVLVELRRYGANPRPEWNWQQIRRLVALNGNILLRTLCLITTFAFFTHQSALKGDTTLAANTVLLNFQMLTALALDGFANAIEALVGAAIGARDRIRFVAAVMIGGAWSLVFAAAFVGFYFMTGSALIRLLTDIVSVRTVAGQYLAWAIASPLVSVWCFVLDGIFIGATKGREMRNSMMIATFAVFLPSWYALDPFGNHGLWLAFMLFFAARGVSLGWYAVRIYRQGGFA